MGIIDGSYVKAHLPDAKAIVADKGYDNECIREQITKKGVRAVIPRKRNSLKGNADMDWSLYRYRHLVEMLLPD
ncbi:MAG: hypothetical protein FCKEOINB_01414 [Nitrosomonas sp.]|nr:hypothetical protein [Nitrosomonas sp.]